MTKKTKKVRVFFTMDFELHNFFDKYIDDNLLDQSKVIEKLIEEYLKTKHIIINKNE